MFRRVFFAFALAGLLSLSGNSFSTTHYVNSGDTIQDAIDLSNEGDTVIVAPGTYYENIRFDGKDNSCGLSGFTTRGDTGTLNGPEHLDGGVSGNGCVATIKNNLIMSNSTGQGENKMQRTLHINAKRYIPLPSDNPRMDTIEQFELDADKTTIVAMHCWNIGSSDGPATSPDYNVGMGYAGTTILANEIIKNVISPIVSASRRAGILVSNIETADIFARHPEFQQEALAQSTNDPTENKVEVVPGYRKAFVDQTYGKGYMSEASPYVQKDRVSCLMPQEGDIFECRSEQFHKLLSARGIENLVYTGFATNMCIQFSSGGIRDMCGYGYRIFIIPEATLGIEYPDTIDELRVTREALRFIEANYGYSIPSAQWLVECERLAK